MIALKKRYAINDCIPAYRMPKDGTDQEPAVVGIEA